MDKVYKVYWSQTALDELAGILAYPPEVKERIHLDSQTRLSYMPTLSAKQISSGILKGYWVKLGLYQVILVFEVNVQESVVWIDELNINVKMYTGSRNNTSSFTSGYKRKEASQEFKKLNFLRSFSIFETICDKYSLDINGHQVKIYDIKKTLCDIARFQISLDKRKIV